MIRQRLNELGYELHAVPLVVRERFHTAVRHNDLVFTAGQVPIQDGEEIRGKVGTEIDVVTAQRAAQLCAVNCLRAVHSIANVEQIERVVKVLGMVNVGEGFDDSATVMDGCSALLARVLGSRGIGHARSSIGVTLVDNWSVEIEMVIAISGRAVTAHATPSIHEPGGMA